VHTLFAMHRRDLIILAGICGLVFFTFLGKTPFHDKGEPREALVVYDIVVNGRWLFPIRLGGFTNLPSKPPLFHWTAAVSSILWGNMSETAIRFPSALYATLGIFLVYYLGTKMYGQEIGLIAGLMLATTFVYQDAASAARVDMTLVFFTTFPLVLFFGLYRGFLRKPLWWYGFFIAAGIGVLAKGPVNIVLCGIVIGAFLAVSKQWVMFRRVLWHPGLILGSAIFLLWYAVALAKGGSDFAGLQLIKENLARFFVYGEDGTGHQKPFYYFVPYLFSLGLPWTIFLPAVVWGVFKYRKFEDDRELFLAIWVAVVFVFFSLSAGKRPPYILPLYPPLALLIAVWVTDSSKRTAEHVNWVRTFGWVPAGIGAFTLITLAGQFSTADVGWLVPLIEHRFKPKTLEDVDLVRTILNNERWLVFSYLAAAGVLWLYVARDFFRAALKPAVIRIGAVAILSTLLVQGVVLPGMAIARSYKDFIQVAKQKTGNGEQLLLFRNGVDISSILFYGADKVDLLPEDADTLLQRLKGSGDYVILREQVWKELGAERSLFPPLIRSRGRGPEGDDRLILIRGVKNQ
jgi:4-amino-4-deoxy-L-arabinose transferase-like glycosyltransferase